MARMIRENEYVLAFDFSLDRLDYSLFSPAGDWIIPHNASENNWPGYQQMKADVLAHLAGLEEDARLSVAGEATGLLWWHAFYHIAADPDFAALDPGLALLNPQHVKHFRRVRPEDDKADPEDSRLIGSYYRTVGVEHPLTFDFRYLPLRHLTRAYCRLTHTLASEKAFALGLVYLLASEYARLKPFADRFSVTSVHLLTEYPDVAALAELPLGDLAETIQTLGRGHFRDPDEKARQLHQIAGDSYPFPDTLRPTVHTVLCHSLDLIRFLEGQQREYQRLIEAELAQLPEAARALAEKGLGPILVGGILSELQDPRRFTTGRKFDRAEGCWRERCYSDGQASVAKMAGLWWPRHSSGRFEGEERRLARERNPYLRYWFVQAAHTLKKHRQDYEDFYRRKYDQVTKHQHKRALILTARKAVRLIFALLHKGQMARLAQEEANTT
jgi:transposase